MSDLTDWAMKAAYEIFDTGIDRRGSKRPMVSVDIAQIIRKHAPDHARLAGRCKELETALLRFLAAYDIAQSWPTSDQVAQARAALEDKA